MTDKTKDIIIEVCSWIASIIFCAGVTLFLLILCSCSSSRTATVEVPVASVHISDTTNISKYINDIVVKDTFIIIQNEQGEVKKEISKHSEKELIVRADTLYIVKQDSIEKPVYIEKVKEKPYIPTWLCWYSIVTTLLLAAIIIVWLIRKKAHQITSII